MCKTQRTARAVLIVYGLALGAIPIVYAQPSLIVVSDLKGSAEAKNGVYTVAQESTTLQFGRVNPAEPLEVTRRAVASETLASESRIRANSKLAYGGGFLVSLAPEDPRVEARDLKTGLSRDLQVKDKLSNPDGVAVSSHGLVAITDSRAGKLLLINLTKASGSEIIESVQLVGLSLPVFQGDVLFARINKMRDVLARIDLDDLRAQRFSAIAEVIDTASISGDLRALSVYGSTLFVGTTSGVFAIPALPRTEHGARSIVQVLKDGVSAVQPDESHLFVIPVGRPEIRVYNRSAPVVVELTGEPAENARALLDLYRYLQKTDVLLSQRTVPTGGAKGPRELFKQPGVLFPALGSIGSDILDSYVALLCTEGSQCDAAFKRPIEGGSGWLPPLVTAKEDWIPVELSDRQAKRTIADRVGPNRQRFAELNGFSAGTLDDFIARPKAYLGDDIVRSSVKIPDDLIASSAATAQIKIGTLVFPSETGYVTGKMPSSCKDGPSPQVTSSPFSLTDRVETGQTSSLLGRLSGKAVLDSTSKVDRIAVSFPRATLSHSDRPQWNDKCESDLARSGAYFVTDTMTATATDIQIFGDSQSVAQAIDSLPQAELNKNLPGGVRVSKPFTIAFSARPVANTPIAASLWPSRAQDLLSQSSGTVRLPIVAWQTYVYLPAQDLLQKQSALWQLQANHNVMQIRPLDTLPSRPQGTLETTSVEDETGLAEDRKNLQRLIHYSFPKNYKPAGIYRFGITVGLVEDFSSLNSAHSALNGVMWAKQPPERDCIANEKPGLCDHATAVASLMTGKYAIGSDLSKYIRLFPVDVYGEQQGWMNDIRQLESNPDRPRIYNVSRTFPYRINQNLLGLENLYIAAADDDKTEVPYDPDALLGELRKPSGREHILGVGRVGSGSGPLPRYPSGSRSYIRLLAPEGMLVPQLKPDKGFVRGQGSSFAVPQVTIAAALITQQRGIFVPTYVSARLIYTADWMDSPRDDRIWGGRLNFQRAVDNLDRTVIRFRNDESMEYITVLDTSNSNREDKKVQLLDGRVFGRDAVEDASKLPSGKLELIRILRITKSKNEDGARVVYVDPLDNQLKIADGVQLNGEVSFEIESMRKVRGGDGVDSYSEVPIPDQLKGVQKAALKDVDEFTIALDMVIYPVSF